MAGEEMDQAIIHHVRETYSLSIGEQRAETIKINLGYGCPKGKAKKMKMKGRDLNTGFPKEIELDSEEMQEAAADKLQQILDLYESGIHIVTVKLQDVHAPGEVKEAFERVASAKEDRERLINEALGKYNQEIPKARGEAEKTIRQAEAYAVQRTKYAEGDANRFLQRLKEYKKAKQVTKDRLYLETMRDTLREIEKVVIPETEE